MQNAKEVWWGHLEQELEGNAISYNAQRPNVMGNPFILTRENKSDQQQIKIACEGFEEILAHALTADGQDLTIGQVGEIGQRRGFKGRIGKWNARAVRETMIGLAADIQRQPIRIDCRCYPGRCHAEVIARWLAKGW